MQSTKAESKTRFIIPQARTFFHTDIYINGSANDFNRLRRKLTRKVVVRYAEIILFCPEYFSQQMRKGTAFPTRVRMHLAKTQISLRRREHKYTVKTEYAEVYNITCIFRICCLFIISCNFFAV